MQIQAKEPLYFSDLSGVFRHQRQHLSRPYYVWWKDGDQWKHTEFSGDQTEAAYMMAFKKRDRGYEVQVKRGEAENEK